MRTTNHRAARKDRLIHEHVHDPYRSRKKPPEPSVCPVCNAVFRGGRWQWVESWPVDAHQETCQACRRMQDSFPAGLITLNGGFVQSHKAEVLNVARHHAQGEQAQHPLHRIMKIEEHPDSVRISTTDLHLARRIGDALHHAFKGNLETHYDQEGCFVRVNWSREG
jgi:NMD protein affecting ribosome stability and mRNA decay